MTISNNQLDFNQAGFPLFIISFDPAPANLGLCILQPESKQIFTKRFHTDNPDKQFNFATWFLRADHLAKRNSILY